MELEVADRFEQQVQQAAAQVHAATAELTRLAAGFAAEEAWAGWGYSSCAQWLSVFGGFDLSSGAEILRVGEALRRLPALSAAFASGCLSLDKLRAVTRVATSADEQIWLEVAESASGAQLQRICREYSRVLTPESDRKLESERGLCIGQRLDGLVTITARLLPEEAEIVFAALKKAEAQQRTPAAALADQPRSWDEREADALVEVCRQALASSALEPAGETPPSRVVVHVDSAVLAGDDDGGRCQGRFRLSAEAARELACDGELQLQAERAGVPIDLGRARRVVSPQLARALRARDGGCRFPGCGRRRVHAHHLEHWAQGGRTDLGNLLSLCGFHHHRLHRGFYRVTGTAARPRFETHDGRLIGAAPPARGAPPAPTASPAVPEYQPRMQLAYAVGAIADGVTLAHRARPG